MRTRRVYAFLFYIPEAAEVISHDLQNHKRFFFFKAYPKLQREKKENATLTSQNQFTSLSLSLFCC